ncbi:MAG: hypothetical protein BMS9Abin05_0857 [Rhodothermia bacterium]|nr:MAG: hypothetical protein BMS9Abin05_0857 [Rhodothermia bacterium]
MSIKNLVLQKGWAGKTISRVETAERVNALIRPLVDLLLLYNDSLRVSADSTDMSAVQQAMPILRADIGKLAETVHSSGAVAYSGAEPTGASPPGKESNWSAVLEREAAFSDTVSKEKEIEHQMRTRAILANVVTNSIHRQELVKQILEQ